MCSPTVRYVPIHHPSLAGTSNVGGWLSLGQTYVLMTVARISVVGVSFCPVMSGWVKSNASKSMSCSMNGRM